MDQNKNSVFRLCCDLFREEHESEGNSSHSEHLSKYQDKLSPEMPNEALEDYLYWLSTDDEKNNDVKDGIVNSIRHQEFGDFVNWKLDHVKRLLDSESYKKAFQHTEIVLNNNSSEECNLTDEQISLACFLQHKAQLFLSPHSQAIESSTFKNVPNLSQLRLRSEDRNYFLPDFLDVDNRELFGEASDWVSCAKVIVDPEGTKGVNSNKQFIVQDLQTALKIAQESDIIYLEKGTYDCSKAAGKSLQIKKSVSIIGSSKSDVILSGSIVKWESCKKLYLDNLQIEISSSNDDDEEEVVDTPRQGEDVYLLGGRTEFKGCIIESSENTAIYLIAGKDNVITEFIASFTIFDGLEECRRMICPKGSKINMSIEHCYVSDCLSFITLIDPNEHHEDCVYAFSDSTFSHLQDAIYFSPFMHSHYKISISGCFFDVNLRDEDVKCVGIHVEGGARIKVTANKFCLNDLDATAIYLKNIHSGTIEMNIAEMLLDDPRTTSLAEGITILGFNDEIILNNNFVSSMRIGYHLASNQGLEPKLFSASGCESTLCSIGLLFELKEMAIWPKNFSIDSLNVNASNYGFMMTTSSGSSASKSAPKVTISDSTFTDVPLPAIIHKNLMDKICMVDNHFTHTLELDSMDPPDADTRTKMLFYYAAEKNMPYRVAFEKSDFVIFDS